MDVIDITPLHMYAPFPGTVDTTREHYRRALLRPPPRFFSIEFLPVSYKGSYHHGIRISPVIHGEGDSITSRSRNWDYEIWRQWEDILWFQQRLESDYSRAAREKKVRLAQGKGVKALNGIYKQDMASSWESLPPGPLPSSVAQDIHEHLPRLSKKGTVFRASQSTIDQRQKEFRALVEALFSDDMPSLIQELRTTHNVTDFFGLWRRDYDLMEKSPKCIRNSVTSSVFSSYFSESSPTLASSASSKRASSRSSSTRRPSSGRPRSAGGSSTNSTIRSIGRISMENLSSSASVKSNATAIKRLSGSSDEGVSAPQVTRPRALSNTSSESSFTHSDGCSETSSTIEATPTIVEDSPITFDHNPHIPVERCSVLEVLPEEREMLAKSPEAYPDLYQTPKSVILPAERRSNRGWQIVSTPVTEPAYAGRMHITRESYQSYSSIDSSAGEFLDGICLSLPSIKEQDYRASMATVMTTNSADAVLPRESPSKDDECSLPERPSNTLTLSEFETYPSLDNSTQDVVSPTDRPRTPTGPPRLSLVVPSTPTRPTHGRCHEDSSFECLPSPATTNVPVSPSALSPTSGCLLSIKAAHNSSIIMLRVSRDTPFEEVRQRLYNKFVGQEGIPLSKEFAVAMVIPSITSPSPAKSSSSSMLSRSSSEYSADKMELHFIDSQDDWEQVVLVREGPKVTLRILDAPRM